MSTIILYMALVVFSALFIVLCAFFIHATYCLFKDTHNDNICKSEKLNKPTVPAATEIATVVSRYKVTPWLKHCLCRGLKLFFSQRASILNHGSFRFSFQSRFLQKNYHSVFQAVRKKRPPTPVVISNVTLRLYSQSRSLIDQIFVIANEVSRVLLCLRLP